MPKRPDTLAPNGSDGLLALALAEAAMKSAKDNGTVRVEETL
jgi:hypothetical protein